LLAVQRTRGDRSVTPLPPAGTVAVEHDIHPVETPHGAAEYLLNGIFLLDARLMPGTSAGVDGDYSFQAQKKLF